MNKHSTVISILGLIVAICAPLYVARDYLPGVNVFLSDAANSCDATGKSLQDARKAFSRACRGQHRKDCDEYTGGWVCSTRDVPRNYQAPIALSPTKPASSECAATASTLQKARSAFSSTCRGYDRKDCDEIDGLWTCSSGQIGSNAPGGGSNTPTNTSPIQPETQPDPEPEAPTKPSSPSEPATAEGASGLIVIEAEDTTSSLDKWVRRTSISGYAGSGYITFTGNTDTNGPATSPLRYSFTPDTSGTYRLMMRMHRNSPAGHADWSNDGYVRLEGDFSAPKNRPTKAELTQNQKYYGGGTSWQWNGDAPLDINDVKFPAEYVLTKGKTYTLVLSGRSKNWSVDRIVMAHSSVSDRQAQSGSASTQTVTPEPDTPPSTVSSELYNGARGDLIALHYDHAPDKDDGHAAAAGFTVVDQLGLQYIVVGGAYGDGNKNTYNQGSEGVMDVVFGRSGWLNAHRAWNDSVSKASEKWAQVLKDGGKIFVAEGGQADFTADVVRKLQNRSDLGGVNLRQSITVVQHSNWNENKANSGDLAFVKRETTYLKIADGNHGGNGTPDLSKKSSDFVRLAKASRYKNAWNRAFQYLDPEREKLDFSDTVELLHILGVSSDEIGDIDGFAKKYLAR